MDVSEQYSQPNLGMVLGYFGFDRSVYGNKKNIGQRKWRWLQELRKERENDIRTKVI
jgi:hypothetical protein